MLEFKENFTLCNIDEINLILDDTFFEAHTMDVWQKSAWQMLCQDGKKMLLKESYEFSRQLSLLILRQLGDERFVIVVQTR